MKPICVGICTTIFAVLAITHASARDRIKVVGSVSTDVIVLEANDRLATDAIAVKSFVIGGSSNAAECSYFEIIEKVKQLAIANGANIIMINQHDQPNGSVCDRVKATLYKSDAATALEKEFTWHKDRKLVWDDFRGGVPKHASDITAATISCEIGFETSTISSEHDDLQIHVYNKFSKSDSWSRREDQNDEVLRHEQGHFDLCELYTRKLRERLSNSSFNVHNMKTVLQNIYQEVLTEYRNTQDRYEAETHHGVDLRQQHKWLQFLDEQLNVTQRWVSS